MKILESILEPFGYTGMPTLITGGKLGTYLTLVAIDWELKKWWDQHKDSMNTPRRMSMKCLRDVAKIHGAGTVHVYSTKGYIMVHYKVNKEWCVTRLQQ